MRKAVFALLALLLSAGTAWAGDDWADHYYYTYPSGVREYTDTVLLKEFKADQAAMQAVLAGKPVEVVGIIESVREATYYADPDNPASAQGRAKAIELDAYVDGGNFVGYLFDDTTPLERLPKVVRKTSFGTRLLCEDVQRGQNGVGLQGKCRLYGLFRLWVQDANAYHNEEIYTWLRTYPSGVRRYHATELVEEYYKSDLEGRTAFKDKQVLVTGKIRGISEETYFSNPSDTSSSQDKVVAIRFTDADYYGHFVGYLFDEQVDTSILREEDDTVELLCSEIQRGRGKVALQGKCTVVGASDWYEAMSNRWEYTNKELYDWLLTPAEAE